jgi:hypothetical protein
MKIYVASSWRNELQPLVVHALRVAGHDVYDFKNPKDGDVGFSWKQVDPNWMSWTAKQTIAAYDTSLALAGYTSDRKAINDCDALVLVQKCGFSSALELGLACGMEKRTCALMVDGQEPDLMLMMADVHVTSISDVVDWARLVDALIRSGKARS